MAAPPVWGVLPQVAVPGVRVGANRTRSPLVDRPARRPRLVAVLATRKATAVNGATEPWHGIAIVGALALLFAIGWWRWWKDRR